MRYFWGIDTSNYTTSAAIASEGRLVVNIREPLYVKKGEKGLRQSDAVFSHIKNFSGVMESIKIKSLPLPCAIGYSYAPRDCAGSYMPCFLAGEAAAYSASAASGAKLYRFSHQRGHIYAALYSAGITDMYDSEFIAFHVSGGTTEALLVRNRNIERIGGTVDLTAGRAIDRAGVEMGYAFPCGPKLEELALRAEAPPVKVCVEGGDCNMSGVENKVKDMLSKGRSHEDIAAMLMEFIRLSLDKITENLLVKYGNLPLVFSGGVMSCSIIRKSLEKKYGAHFADPELSSDNAGGIALLCERAYYEK